MRIKFYRQLNRRVRSDPTMRRVVLLSNEMLTYLIMIIYGAELIRTVIRDGIKPFLLLILVPLFTFAASRLLRMFLREPRPYRAGGIKPLTRRQKNSYSFPSCHIASAFVIGTCLFALSMRAAGIAVMILGTALAVFRVLAGVHYIRDVAAGAVIGVLGGLIPLLMI